MIKRKKAQIAVPHEPCRRDAAFVAWMLCISPFDVFPCGPDSGEEGDDHLILTMTAHVDDLAVHLDHDEDDGSNDFAAYRRRVLMCVDAIAGKKFAPPQSMWETIAIEYGRGRYLSHKAHLRRPHG